jgi:TPR repeat protein
MLTKPIPCIQKWVILNKIADWHQTHSNYVQARSAYEEILNYPNVKIEYGENDARAFSNYCHNACIDIAQCYEKQGDIDSAIVYATRSTNYPGWHFCGMAPSPYEEAVRYINRLNEINSARKGLKTTGVTFAVDVPHSMKAD